jgi:hypothetical protein
MDNRPERTIETLPGFQPLHVVPWTSGYGVDIMCGDLVIGSINEGFRNQFRAEFNNAYTPHRGWHNTHEFCFDEKDAFEWIRKQWCAFLERIKDQ